jgi:UDP-N-acetylglucosamine acyltransferase
MSSEIHETAVISPEATIGDGVTIGPNAEIEDDVHIGAGTSNGAHAVIRRFTRIGRNNAIDAHAVLGGKPQHTAFYDSRSGLEIGDDNVIR